MYKPEKLNNNKTVIELEFISVYMKIFYGRLLISHAKKSLNSKF
jgi:hypothetical protein